MIQSAWFFFVTRIHAGIGDLQKVDNMGIECRFAFIRRLNLIKSLTHAAHFQDISADALLVILSTSRIPLGRMSLVSSIVN